MSKFQMIVTGLFAVFIVVGVIIFSIYKGNSKSAVTVTVWGTIPQSSFSEILQGTSLYQSKEFTVIYSQKSEEDFDRNFLEALASGTGPDIFMLPSEKILQNRNKVFPIPYASFAQRQFKDTFIEGAEIFMAPEGVLAMPIYADPLVMYWNRQMFTDAQLTVPPKYWDEFYDLANSLSKKDGALNILKSAVAFGEFANVSHAKEIILNMAMQAGTPITIWNGNKVQNVFAETMGKPIVPAQAAVNFYTEFSNPAKPSYSWNRSLPDSVNYFLGGDLALYFGFASEIGSLQLKNPNLNFDVATVPVSREGGVNVSFARFNSLAITKSSKNIAAAFSVAGVLSGVDGAKSFSKVLKLPPARRDLLGQKPANSFESVFYKSAIKSKTWLDPYPSETSIIFKNMVESITSGRLRTEEAVIRASNEISSLLPK